MGKKFVYSYQNQTPFNESQSGKEKDQPPKEQRGRQKQWNWEEGKRPQDHVITWQSELNKLGDLLYPSREGGPSLKQSLRCLGGAFQ
jgi:hypothetical protein